MKTMMRSGKSIRRGVSLLLMMSLLIALLPIIPAAAVTVPGAYGTVTVTGKNVVIRTSPAGSRTGYYAQPGTYPMIGPKQTVNGVTWYNLQTGDAAGYVHGDYAYGTYGGAGMPATAKKYVKFTVATTIYKGDDASNPVLSGGNRISAALGIGTVLQMETGTPYSATYGGSTSQYVNVYYKDVLYHTLYTAEFQNGVLSTDALNAYIADITWKATATASDERVLDAKGDFMTHAIQAALKILGYYEDGVDGNYGPDTYSAVNDFRKANPPLVTTTGTTTVEVLEKLFPQASDRLAYLRSNPGLSTDTGDTGTGTAYTVKTLVEKLRIRKSYSTSSEYLGIIATKGTVLNYTNTQLNGTVTWYYIVYQGTYGWVMGTYVEDTSTGGGTPSESTDYGTATVTKKWTQIRKTPGGAQTGYHLNIGDVCTMIGPSTASGGYTWYNIRTESGRTGYIRSDCATADFGSAGMPDTAKKYVQFLYDNMKATPGLHPDSATGAEITIPKNSVLQLQSGNSYTDDSVSYINVYYKNEVYFTAYNAKLIEGLLTTDKLNKYIINTVWVTGLPSGDIAGETLGGSITIRTSDVYVHAIQAALYELGLYKDAIDGIYGSKTADAVKAYKNNYGILPINETIGHNDSLVLFASGKSALEAKRNGTGGGTAVGDFGTVKLVKKGSWAEIDNGILFPRNSVATVMSVDTKQVFRLYRWSGSNHADCVTYDTTDTAVLCAILGVTYSSAKPSSSELALIKGAGNDDWPAYTWPKLRWAGVTNTAGGVYKIPVWVNLKGTVYCASIYVIPHGFTGTSGFSTAKRDGKYYYEQNNMYGMVCVHFYGSLTHGTKTEDPEHKANINEAYTKAPVQFPGKVQ